jgi:hypothetical protein
MRLTMKKIYASALVAAMLFVSNIVWAQGEFYVIAGGRGVGTKVTKLPCEINQPGFYYLAGNLTSTGHGFVVNVPNVTIDLMGFTMTGPGITAMAMGIIPSVNCEIRNGTITNFFNGIFCELIETIGVKAVNLKVTKCGCGIIVSQGVVQDCFVSENNGEAAGGGGIIIYKGIVTGNTVTKNNLGLSVSNCTVTNNVITDNVSNGVQTEYCLFNNNIIRNNNTGGYDQNIKELSLTNVFGTNQIQSP